MKKITKVIRKRRSIFPNSYIDKKIPKPIIEEVLENANWAPTHKLTQPWRFKVLTGNALERLGDFMAEWYQNNTSEERFSELKMNKKRKNPMASACVIAICMQRDPKESVPEWEEIASVAAAVQNMWLTCTAHDIGAYWSSPAAIKDVGLFLNMEEGERCLGFFYMGYHELENVESERDNINEKVDWIAS